jgi:ribosomal protein S27E
LNNITSELCECGLTKEEHTIEIFKGQEVFYCRPKPKGKQFMMKRRIFTPKIEKNEEICEKETLEEFKRRIENEDYNIVDKWDNEHFKVKCNKCQSEDVLIFFRDEEGAMGSEYTGYMRGFICDNGLIVKCKDCGNAMTIQLPY